MLEVLRSGRLALGPDDRPLRARARRAGRCAVRGRRLERHGGASPLRPAGRPRPGRRGDHLAVLVRRLGELHPLRGRDAGLRRRRPGDAQPRPGAVEAAITPRDEGDRRRRHLRLPVRARRVLRELAERARARADRGRLRGARRRVPRAGRSAPTSTRPSSPSTQQAGDDRARGARSPSTRRRSGGCSRASRTRAAPTRAAGSSTRASATTTASTTSPPPWASPRSRSSTRSSRCDRRPRRATASCSTGVDGVEPLLRRRRRPPALVVRVPRPAAGGESTASG